MFHLITEQTQMTPVTRHNITYENNVWMCKCIVYTARDRGFRTADPISSSRIPVTPGSRRVHTRTTFFTAFLTMNPMMARASDARFLCSIGASMERLLPTETPSESVTFTNCSKFTQVQYIKHTIVSIIQRNIRKVNLYILL